MNRSPSLRRLRVHYKEGKSGLFDRIDYEREINEIISGAERCNVSTADAVRNYLYAAFYL